MFKTLFTFIAKTVANTKTMSSARLRQSPELALVSQFDGQIYDAGDIQKKFRPSNSPVLSGVFKPQTATDTVRQSPPLAMEEALLILSLANSWGHWQTHFALQLQKFNNDIKHKEVRQAAVNTRVAMVEFNKYLTWLGAAEGDTAGLSQEQMALIKAAAKAWVTWRVKTTNPARYGSCLHAINESKKDLNSYLIRLTKVAVH